MYPQQQQQQRPQPPPWRADFSHYLLIFIICGAACFIAVIAANLVELAYIKQYIKTNIRTVNP